MSTSPGRRTVLAFDYGIRRMGVAVGQELLGTATPLAPLKAKDGVPDWSEIERLLRRWEPQVLLVGLPLNMDGSDSDMTARARKFGNRLHGRFNKPVEYGDERLSSFEAKGMAIERGMGRDFGEVSVDGMAAALILESWFLQQKQTPA